MAESALTASHTALRRATAALAGARRATTRTGGPDAGEPPADLHRLAHALNRRPGEILGTAYYYWHGERAPDALLDATVEEYESLGMLPHWANYYIRLRLAPDGRVTSLRHGWFLAAYAGLAVTALTSVLVRLL